MLRNLVNKGKRAVHKKASVFQQPKDNEKEDTFTLMKTLRH